MGIFNIDALITSAAPTVNEFIDKTLLEQYYSTDPEVAKEAPEEAI